MVVPNESCQIFELEDFKHIVKMHKNKIQYPLFPKCQLQLINIDTIMVEQQTNPKLQNVEVPKMFWKAHYTHDKGHSTGLVNTSHHTKKFILLVITNSKHILPRSPLCLSVILWPLPTAQINPHFSYFKTQCH